MSTRYRVVTVGLLVLALVAALVRVFSSPRHLHDLQNGIYTVSPGHCDLHYPKYKFDVKGHGYTNSGKPSPDKYTYFPYAIYAGGQECKAAGKSPQDDPGVVIKR